MVGDDRQARRMEGEGLSEVSVVMNEVGPRGGGGSALWSMLMFDSEGELTESKGQWRGAESCIELNLLKNRFSSFTFPRPSPV